MPEESNPASLMAHLNARLSTWANEYYNLGEPSVPDNVYDAMYVELQELEKKHPELSDPNSITRRHVGTVSAGFAKVTHDYPMMSLKTVTDYQSPEPCTEFWKAIQIASGLKSPEITAELKYDGLAISLKYVDAKLVLAATRGDYFVGEDVTNNVRNIPTVPSVLPKTHGTIIPTVLTVRGEVVMLKSSLEAINASRMAQGLKPYANCRNAAAGAIRRHDSSTILESGLIFIPYEVSTPEIHFVPDTQCGTMAWLTALGFQSFSKASWTCASPSRMFEIYEEILRDRASLPMDIDGVVFKTANTTLQDQMGYVGREPRWAYAHKFMPEVRLSRILKIITQVGRTGAITPVAVIDPVFVGGTMVTNITLHNFEEIARKDLRVGDTVEVRRAGDVIPEIVRYITAPQDHELLLKTQRPDHCPSCGTALSREETHAIWRCTNSNECTAQSTGRVLQFVSRQAMNIEGVGESLVDALISAGVVSSWIDLYVAPKSICTPTPSESFRRMVGLIQEMPRQSAKTARKLAQAILDSLSRPLHCFLFGLSIRHLGQESSKALARCIGAPGELLNLTEEKLLKIPDFGPELTQSVLKYIADPANRQAVQNFIRFGYSPVSEVAVGTAMVGYKVCLSGSMDPFSKPSLTADIEALGGEVVSGVSRATTLLVAGPGSGEKTKKAMKLGIQITTDVVEFGNKLKEMINDQKRQ